MEVRENAEQPQGSGEMDCVPTPHGLDGEVFCRSIQDVSAQLAYDPGARDARERSPDPSGIGGGHFSLLLRPDNGAVDFQHGQA